MKLRPSRLPDQTDNQTHLSRDSVCWFLSSTTTTSSSTFHYGWFQVWACCKREARSRDRGDCTVFPWPGPWVFQCVIYLIHTLICLLLRFYAGSGLFYICFWWSALSYGQRAIWEPKLERCQSYRGSCLPSRQGPAASPMWLVQLYHMALDEYWYNHGD